MQNIPPEMTGMASDCTNLLLAGVQSEYAFRLLFCRLNAQEVAIVKRRRASPISIKYVIFQL